MRKLHVYWGAFKYRLWYLRNRSKFKRLGRKSFINAPLAINGFKNISIGNNVAIGYKSWIAALPLTGEKECILEFGDGCMIGNFNHIYATKKVVFGNKVLTADKVYISDNIHGYSDILTPIAEQPIVQKKEVYIGDGSWIGEFVSIIGASIGKNCVIGANSVVIKDVPDYAVVAGNPARMIKRYCLETKQWRKTSPEGEFI